MLSTGFGFVEVGSVTPEPQDGNPKPRIFRLEKDRAVINRCGFNSVGSFLVSERLRKRLSGVRKAQPGVVGVNLGKNRDTQDAKLDYEKGVVAFADIADYLVINVSSPNTPNLRNLQQKNQLVDLLEHVIAVRDATLKERSPNGRPPILVKISPDLSDEELKVDRYPRVELAIYSFLIGYCGCLYATIDRWNCYFEYNSSETA